MALVRKIYPEDLLEYLRGQIEEVFKDSLGLAIVDTGTELGFLEDAPASLLPAVMIDLEEDETMMASPLGHVDVEYFFVVHYVRAMADDDRPKSGLFAPLKALREFFLRDNYEQPLFSVSGHKIKTAFPGRCVYGQPEELRKAKIRIEQASFQLLVTARSEPVQL